MKIKIMIAMGICLILAVVTVIAAEQNKGAAEMTIDGKGRGPVPFKHELHQTVLGDCMVCHDVFPQTAGSINDLKEKGNLKKKQVMNKVCIKCHKAKKKAGEKTGPTSCSKCHIR